MFLFHHGAAPPRAPVERATPVRDALRQKLLAMILKNEALRRANSK